MLSRINRITWMHGKTSKSGGKFFLYQTITFFFLTQTKNMGSSILHTNYMVSYTLSRPQRPHPAKLKLNRLTCWPTTKTPWRLFSTTDFRFGMFGGPRYYSSGCWLVVYTNHATGSPKSQPNHEIKDPIQQNHHIARSGGNCPPGEPEIA